MPNTPWGEYYIGSDPGIPLEEVAEPGGAGTQRTAIWNLCRADRVSTWGLRRIGWCHSRYRAACPDDRFCVFSFILSPKELAHAPRLCHSLPASSAQRFCRRKISTWQLGGSDGLSWSESDSVRIFIDFDSVPGAIQPIYLTSAQNRLFSPRQLVPVENFPREMGYVDGQRPPSLEARLRRLANRTQCHVPNRWRQHHLQPPVFGPAELRLVLPLDVGGCPSPATRFGFFTPPRGFPLRWHSHWPTMRCPPLK